MITITVLGLDDNSVGHYYKENTENLANIYETEPENVSFFACEGVMIHEGVEQTSWNVILRVNAPEKYEILEEKIADYLLKTFKDFAINIAVEFSYYYEDRRYEHINEAYPRFIKEDNAVNVEPEELGDGEELYEGNVFEGFEDKLDEIYDEDNFKK